MSTSQSSAFLADLRTRLAPYGVVGPAVDWLVKALHPAIAMTAPSMPDETYVESVRPEYRAQEVVSAPAGLTAASWDLIVIRVPGDATPVFWASGNSGIDFGTTGALAYGLINLTGYDFGPPAAWPNLSPPGTPLALATVVPADERESWRTTYASLTAYMTASALNDQGTIFAAQIPRVFRPGAIPAVAYGITDPSGNNLVVSQRVGYLPMNEDSLLLMSPKAYTAPARDGCYAPVRLTGPTQPFVRPGVPLGLLQSSGANYSANVGSLTGETQTGAYFEAPIQFVVGAIRLGVSGTPNNFNWGADNTSCLVVIFRGLSPSASITLKYYTGLELEVRPDSVVRQFAVVPTAYSPQAMQAYYRIVQEMPAVYPSSFNSLGTLASGIMGVAERLWPFVRPVVRGVAERVVSLTTPPNLASRQEVRVVQQPSSGMTKTQRKTKGKKTVSIRARSISSRRR